MIVCIPYAKVGQRQTPINEKARASCPGFFVDAAAHGSRFFDAGTSREYTGAARNAFGSYVQNWLTFG